MDIEKLFYEKLRRFAIAISHCEGAILSERAKTLLFPDKDSLWDWKPPTELEILDLLYDVRRRGLNNRKMANEVWGERLVHDIFVALEHRPGKYQNAFQDKRYSLAAYHGHTLLYLATGFDWSADNHPHVPSYTAQCYYDAYEALELTGRLKEFTGSRSWNSMRDLKSKEYPWMAPDNQPCLSSRQTLGVISIPLWGIERYLNRGTEVAINLGIL